MLASIKFLRYLASMKLKALPRKATETWSYWALIALLGVLLVVGGASRSDVLGQPIARLASWMAVLFYIIFLHEKNSAIRRFPILFLGAAVLLVALQLVPLPPGIWTQLPGREIFMEAARISTEAQPWRPISVSPSATMNSLHSLVVPLAVLLLASKLSLNQNFRTALAMLAMVALSALLAILQFTGVNFDNPFVNDIGLNSGTFANRNHLALFVACGSVFAFALVSSSHLSGRNISPLLLALVPLFLLAAIASGSRMGIVLGLLAIVFGFAIAWREIVHIKLSGSPLFTEERLTSLPIVAASIAGLVLMVAATVVVGRAEAVDRLFSLEPGEDLRAQIIPMSAELAWFYWPFGSGIGAFDPVFRISEPTSLLQPLYVNHAHSDWVEVILDGGMGAVILAVAALVWWTRRTFFWMQGDGVQNRLALTGSAIIGLTMIASITDYPARTPLFMALLAIGSVWLSQEGSNRGVVHTHSRSVDKAL